MKCFSCGAELDRDYIDCPNCGENLDKAYKKMKGIVIIDDSPLLLSPKKKLGISIIIPVKNPEPYLEQLTHNVYDLLNRYSIPHEMLIQREVGLTNAVIEGVKRSNFSLIAVMDADGSHPPWYLKEMYEQFFMNPNVDLVIGSKNVPGGVDHSPYYRRFISQVFRSLARFLLDLDVSDPMSGFVMGRIKWFRLLYPSNDLKFLLQLLCLNPPWVVELPIEFLPRRAGKSKSNFMTGVRSMKLLLKAWRKTRR